MHDLYYYLPESGARVFSEQLAQGGNEQGVMVPDHGLLFLLAQDIGDPSKVEGGVVQFVIKGRPSQSLASAFILVEGDKLVALLIIAKQFPIRRSGLPAYLYNQAANADGGGERELGSQLPPEVISNRGAFPG